MNFGIVGFGRMGQLYKRILEDLGIKIVIFKQHCEEIY